MTQDTIDKIINIQFKYSDLVDGWKRTSAEIESAKTKLKQFQEAGDYQGIIKQKSVLKALNDELRQYNREIQNNIKEEVKASGSIDQMNARISKLTAQYKAMSDTVRKSSVGEGIAKEIASIQTEVNTANEALLNFRSNVGNYASAAKGFDPLNFQVQQLAREMPSLTISVQQFFLAISNNLPMLTDELKKAKEANKALRLEGKSTTPVFKQMISAIFSWQTALVLGITLITAYGKEIGQFIKGLFGAKEAAISMAEAQVRVNDVLAKDGFGIGDQITRLKALQRQWSDLGDDLNAKRKFIVDNKDAFDDLGVSVNNVNGAENFLVQHTDDFINALKLRAQATAANKLAVEAYEKAIIEEQKIEDKIAKGVTRTVFGAEAGDPLTVSREYTNAEKKNLMANANALYNQADAYFDLSIAKEKEAKTTLNAAGIVELANDGVSKSTERLMTLEDMQAKMRDDNAKKYASAVNKEQQSVYKGVVDAYKWMQSELDKMDKGHADEVKKQLSQRALEYQNRIKEAQLSGGDAGAAREVLSILREQLSELDRMESTYRALGYTDAEIQSMRLKAREEIQNAERGIQQEEQKTIELSARNTGRMLGSASQLAGSLSSMFEALGGEGERYAEFAKALAVFQVMLAQGEAIANAVAAGAKAPWFMLPFTIAASIAAVVAAIAQATQKVDSANMPSYASGGLITGPGTGTSDSIMARVSDGEAVMTARAVNEWGPVLSAINVSGGGNAINTSSLPQRNDGMKGMKRMMQQIMLEMPAPIVLVKDINAGQNRVRVAANLGKLGRKK